MVKAMLLSIGLVGCAATPHNGQSQAKAQSQQDDTMMIAIIGGLLAVGFIGFAIACGDKGC